MKIEVVLTDESDEDVDGPRWAVLLAAVLEAEGVAPGAQAGLTFVTPSAMAELNQAHMGGSGPTDVLAFPIDGLDAAGGPSPGIVGDVVVCPVVAWAGAADHAGSDDDELALLVVHGALHLLGHDHAEDDEREVMQGREQALLAAHHGALAGDPWKGEA
ncbi:MAG TPA: rRNA maturation RNase YbeY [Iamia sp.]